MDGHKNKEMADTLRAPVAVALVVAALLAMIAKASGQGAGCIPGACLAQCQGTGAAGGACTPTGCVCGPGPGASFPAGPQGLICNNARCLETCREYNTAVVRAHCSTAGTCKCEWLQPPHQPCSIIKCDRQCRMDTSKPLLNARCAPNGSCRCTYKELCKPATCSQQCKAKKTGDVQVSSYCQDNTCHCKFSRIVFSPKE